MRDELVDLEVAVHVVVDEAGKLSAALDAAKGAALPDTTGNELECCIIALALRLWQILVAPGEDEEGGYPDW